MSWRVGCRGRLAGKELAQLSPHTPEIPTRASVLLRWRAEAALRKSFCVERAASGESHRSWKPISFRSQALTPGDVGIRVPNFRKLVPADLC